MGGQQLADGGDDIMLASAESVILTPSLSVFSPPPQPSPVAVFGRRGKVYAIILYFDTLVWRWWCLIN